MLWVYYKQDIFNMKICSKLNTWSKEQKENLYYTYIVHKLRIDIFLNGMQLIMLVGSASCISKY